jgi:hypothetical protein
VPNLRSLNAFQKNQTQNFKVYGDDLSNCDVTNMTTHVAGLKWQNWSTPGHGQNHLNVKADLVTTFKEERVTDTTGDLTITVTDTQTGQTATQSFTVVYLN